MNLDVQTLAVISCLTFLTQVLVLFIQFFVNRTYLGVRWWLVGTSLSALGVILMPLVVNKTLEIFARIANPLVLLGQIFLYIGIVRFLDKKENRWGLFAIFVVSNLFYYYFMFGYNSISGRAFSLLVALTLISFMTASRLYFNKDRHNSGSANFTSIVFLVYGCFCASRIFFILFSPPIQSYSDQALILSLSFIVPTIASLLWTYGFIIMLNQHLNAEIREEKEKLRMIFNTSPDAAIISRLKDGAIVDVNTGFLRLSGYTRTELIENTTIKINIWHQISDRERFVSELEDKGFCENLEFVFQRKDRSLLTGSLSAKVISIQSIPHIISIIDDITHRKQAETAMRESEELYHSILNASPDDITITDLNGCILVTSPAATEMFGYNPESDHIFGAKITNFIIPEDRERAVSNISCMFKGNYSGPNEYHALHKDHSTFDIEVNSGLIHGADGQPVKMVFIIRNITERKQTELRIEHLIQQLELEKRTAQLNANTDSLTGLANRRFFDEALTSEFHRLKRSGSPLSLIMLDVDHFKKFNDTYGHLAGDDCLRQMGGLLQTLVRRVTDMVARYGGEEFVVILTETDQDGAYILAERIRKAVEALAIPHSGSEISDVVTVSLGVVTVIPTRLESPEQVVELADAAMYHAKDEGRNRTSVTTETAIVETLRAA